MHNTTHCRSGGLHITLLAAAIGAVVASGCKSDGTPLGPPPNGDPPRPATQEQSGAEAWATALRLDPEFAEKVRVAWRHAPGTPPELIPMPVSLADPTSSGEAAATNVIAIIDPPAGDFAVTIATAVTSGFGLSVEASSTGGYTHPGSTSTNDYQPFSLSCFAIAPLQSCARSRFFFDLMCWDFVGEVWQFSVHQARFLLVPDNKTMLQRESCGPLVGGGGGGGDDCEFREDDGGPDPCPPDDGSGSGGDSGSGGGGGGGEGVNLCTEYALDPGCYDVYIDGVFSGVVCC